MGNVVRIDDGTQNLDVITFDAVKKPLTSKSTFRNKYLLGQVTLSQLAPRCLQSTWNSRDSLVQTSNTYTAGVPFCKVGVEGTAGPEAVGGSFFS